MTADRAGCDGVALTQMRWWDIPDVHQLEATLFEPDPWTIPQFWSELAGVPETRDYLLARDAEGTLLGYAGLFTALDAAEVQTIAVARGAQGRGIGRMLLNRLLQRARERGARTVALEVRADNGPAAQLYRSSGFVVDGRRRGYYGAGIDAVLMTCHLEVEDVR
jgi:ribosomal-protein-alanine N-acetyltransferase